MGWGGHLRATLKLGGPLVGSQIGLTLINTTDTVMLGWYSIEALAAAVLATPMFFTVMIFGSGFSQAVMPIAAQAEGRGDTRGVRRAVRMGLWVAIAYSALVMALLWFTEDILLALGQDPGVAAPAGDYMRIAQWAMLPTLVAQGLRAFLSAVERPRVIFWSTVAGAILNAGLNWALIFGNWGAPEMGVRGAAIASLGTTVLTLAVLVAYVRFDRKASEYEVFARFWRPDWPDLREVLRLGLPISIMILAEVGMFVVSSILMGWIGVAALAAHGIAMQITSIAFMVPLGMSQAATVRVGRAHGRGDAMALNRAAGSALAICLVFASMSGVLFWVLPEFLISLFLDNAEPQAPRVIAYAVPLLMVAAAFQLLDSAQAVGAGLLRGLKDTRVPMLLAIASYWGVGFPMAYGLAFIAGLGGVGVWSGLAAGLGLAAVSLNGRFMLLRPKPQS
ncbi:MATE family efflux transporter [Oricola sp.]|uniref:MATE family efflux transporter n=1 Tax=Oricola sp. TaxID=1979950 RepID=UPI0025CD6801|nr:MATE family efflux transporter [Oricola sp.]MCI5074243.1 MATE family efflux transporter [Oricola sp.]